MLSALRGLMTLREPAVDGKLSGISMTNLFFGDDTPRDQLDVKTELKNITTVMPQLYAWLGGKPD